jgi:large conductance mechanosensitive channel
MAGFRRFLLRGNLLDLAVAVVVGVAFNAVVQALIRDLITPLIAAAGGDRDFSGLRFTFHNSTFRYGDLINAAVSFLLIMAVVYYLVVAPTARIAALAESREQVTERPCPECLSDIPLAARRCRFCTAAVAPVNGAPARAPAPAAPLRDRLTWRPRS